MGSRLAGTAALALGALLAGCASGPRNDGAPASPPPNLSQVPDAQPQVEAIRDSGGTAKPYNVNGRRYVPITDDRPFQERGMASWYGTGFHAQRTASGEAYDMYAMTAAHKTLPLPSYVRVRNPANGREAIVRVNDRGPFVDGRIIDLSYAAANRLGFLAGVAPVEIERITNEDIRTGAWRRNGGTQVASAAPVAMSDAANNPPVVRAPAPTGGARPVMVPAALAVPVAANPAETSAATGTTAPTDMLPPTQARRPLQVEALSPMAPLSGPAPGASAANGAALPADAAKAAPTANASQASANDFWVQLGAFSTRDGALAMQERIGRDTARPIAELQVWEEGGLFRLQSGPYATREEAAQIQARWRLQLGGSPILVQRR
ncbi:septal ring lytic transglycosylase RlpA family protein [Variovorax dokdonensis]